MALAVTSDAYQRAVHVLDSVSWRGIRPGLERTRELLERLGDPQIGLRGVLIAGTNGKGSVAALVDSVCRAAGMHSVLLTKPHLVSYCERFVRDGVPITEGGFGELIARVAAAAGELPEESQPTAFEMLTAAGIWLVAQAKPDVAVVEVGLGGRLDSTNVLDLDVNVITNVALDHQEQLGDTVVDIAEEKAQIIKPGSVAVTAASAPALEVIRARASSVGAPLAIVDAAGRSKGLGGVQATATFDQAPLSVECPLLGGFQVANVATAVATCDALRGRGFAIQAADVVRGCATVRWPGRMQWFDGSPPVLVDGAHNPAGMAAMARSVGELASDRRTVAVFAALDTKDAQAMAGVLSELTQDVVVTAPAAERARSPDELAGYFVPAAIAVDQPGDALRLARERAGADGLVVVCGSLYLAGEVLPLLGGENGL